VAARREADRLLAEGCAFVVPITHQRVADDRALAASRPVFPLILGGHEHDALLEDRDGTVLVKAPADAVAAAILDVEIGEGAPKVHARFEAVSLYPEDPELRARADRHLQRVRELETATLYFLPEGGHGGEVLSSVGTRVQQTSMGTLTCSRLRDALGAEACVFNGGGIRGSRAYQGQLTYGDLKTEVPFDNEIVVVRMPGRVLRDAIAHSRAKAPRESGGFLQVDDGVVVDARHQVVSVGGSPLDPERRYRVATVRNLFEGMDHVTPFVDFAQAEPAEIPMKTSGRDVKVVLVGAFSELLWEQLGGFPAIDRDRDGRVTASEILEAIARKAQAAPSPMAAQIVLDALDGDRDGVITAAGPRDLT
jgi:2',3'-cyclic-nucleotide 2'-phosphodiesterase (5'-nucleotidase family)